MDVKKFSCYHQDSAPLKYHDIRVLKVLRIDENFRIFGCNMIHGILEVYRVLRVNGVFRIAEYVMIYDILRVLRILEVNGRL